MESHLEIRNRRSNPTASDHSLAQHDRTATRSGALLSLSMLAQKKNQSKNAKVLSVAAKALARGAPSEIKAQRLLPNADAVAWAAHRFCNAIFAIGGSLGESSAEILDDAADLLHPEMIAAFVASRCSQRVANERTDRTLRALVRALPKIQRILLLDLDGAFERDPAAQNKLEIVLCYPGMRALCAHRIAHELHRQSVPLIPRMIAESAHDSTGIDIHPGAVIGSGFFIDHGTSVVIGETSIIGRNCTIYQGVTLGARRFDRHADGSIRRGVKRHPTLKDNVTVYANATILGGTTVIGTGSVIAAGVLIQESVPAYSVVKPARTELTVAPSRQ